ncbi:MAG: hypothetical protein ACNYPI_07575 [Arenicellales bacterium WSBS_2016_MAG_OTU3]
MYRLCAFAETTRKATHQSTFLRYVGTLIEQTAAAEADNDDPVPVVSDTPDKVYSVCPYVCADRMYAPTGDALQSLILRANEGRQRDCKRKRRCADSDKTLRERCDLFSGIYR